ncbi:Holliday junction resolvase RuvX [Arundinibacter roseus]|uniref:Putative pre-16S rRNA nuclease n=1 Tax=Arundinibacter roseus TaxID=2070510 RepID=A0A4R4KLL0_9BACT|nr:Holliday junction resolvase RuvX [Arundinibacter roseus]TDB69267.1 Holliday junction resolvase RuvX [Arundinibacter roseus]
MPRLLAIDYGSKRTGLAVTDPMQIIATALETVRTHLLLDFLKEYIGKEDIAGIVIGMPRKLDSSDTHNTQPVRTFIKKLENTFPEIPVYPHDERFTSSMALRAMIAGGSKKSERREKGNLDKVSATIILQSFMESQQINPLGNASSRD